MTDTFPNWLTKRMLKKIRGFNIDAYLMALEGWRRGLTLTWYQDPTKVTDLKLVGFNPIGKTFSLQDKDSKKLHYFYRSRGDMVSNDAVDIVHHKNRAKEYLNKLNVPTPKGIMIDVHTNQSELKLKQRKSSLNFPLVVKPTLGSLGKGVTTNIQNEDELSIAIQAIKDNYEYYNEIIIEEYVEGDEYRVYVVGNEVSAVTKKVTANVIGDGVSNVNQLIRMKNKERKKNPYLVRKLITVNDAVIKYLEKNNLSLETIPQKGEIVQLINQSNISVGGDPIDATDDLDKISKKVAVEAVKSIPDLYQAGVDIIVSKERTVVLEVNATASISMHIFPMKGEARNVPSHILNYYYPKTVNSAIDKNDLFFDYKNIRRLLVKNTLEKITLTDVPTGDFYKTRFIISGEVQKVGFRHWIRRRAVEHNLSGYVRNLKNGNVVVIVGGNKEKVLEFKKLCKIGSKKAYVNEVKELKWNSSIKSGFEIRKSQK